MVPVLESTLLSIFKKMASKPGILFNERKQTCTYDGGFICKYVFPNLKWFERSGLITHIDQLKYQNFEESKDEI